MRSLMLAFVALTFLAFTLVGCASTPTPAQTAGTVLAVAHEVRERVCDPALDPYLGALQSRPCPCAIRSSGSAETPIAPAPPVTPPVAPSAPATPPAPSVPSVAPAPAASPPATPAKEGVLS